MMSGEVTCASCGSRNPHDHRFCSTCGTSCPSCGTPAGPGARFCGACGTNLAGAAPAPASTPTPTPTSERRLCSVLFADLVGFTSLSETRDHESDRG
ncbi:zinc ribbon domain-containing protein [uncultured Jatrophihabitans sp.]|uniref:double zinc ribbon domain-containing protein n=1 Tax=uncultured Jatrophihabitans sp. TaxID=1610747 RepID=UPI0035CB6783